MRMLLLQKEPMLTAEKTTTNVATPASVEMAASATITPPDSTLSWRERGKLWLEIVVRVHENIIKRKQFLKKGCYEIAGRPGDNSRAPGRPLHGNNYYLVYYYLVYYFYHA